MQQEENQTVTSFYDSVMRKYKKANEFITEQQVVIVLQTGVKQSLKEQLIRKEKDIDKPETWLHLAKAEEYIQKQIQQQRNGSYSGTTAKPFFGSMMTTTVQSLPQATQSSNQHVPMPYNLNRQRNRPSYQLTERPIRATQQPRTVHRNPMRDERQDSRGQQLPWTERNNQPTNYQRSTTNAEKKQQLHPNPCLICNRNNHLTSECFYKKDTGCFKCGQSNHRMRDCPEHFFE